MLRKGSAEVTENIDSAMINLYRKGDYFYGVMKEKIKEKDFHAATHAFIRALLYFHPEIIRLFHESPLQEVTLHPNDDPPSQYNLEKAVKALIETPTDKNSALFYINTSPQKGPIHAILKVLLDPRYQMNNLIYLRDRIDTLSTLLINDELDAGNDMPSITWLDETDARLRLDNLRAILDYKCDEKNKMILDCIISRRTYYPKSLLAIGKHYFNQGKYNEAILCFKSITRWGLPEARILESLLAFDEKLSIKDHNGKDFFQPTFAFSAACLSFIRESDNLKIRILNDIDEYIGSTGFLWGKKIIFAIKIRLMQSLMPSDDPILSYTIAYLKGKITHQCYDKTLRTFMAAHPLYQPEFLANKSLPPSLLLEIAHYLRISGEAVCQILVPELQREVGGNTQDGKELQFATEVNGRFDSSKFCINLKEGKILDIASIYQYAMQNPALLFSEGNEPTFDLSKGDKDLLRNCTDDISQVLFDGLLSYYAYRQGGDDSIGSDLALLQTVLFKGSVKGKGHEKQAYSMEAADIIKNIYIKWNASSINVKETLKKIEVETLENLNNLLVVLFYAHHDCKLNAEDSATASRLSTNVYNVCAYEIQDKLSTILNNRRFAWLYQSKWTLDEDLNPEMEKISALFSFEKAYEELIEQLDKKNKTEFRSYNGIVLSYFEFISGMKDTITLLPETKIPHVATMIHKQLGEEYFVRFYRGLKENQNALCTPPSALFKPSSQLKSTLSLFPETDIFDVLICQINNDHPTESLLDACTLIKSQKERLFFIAMLTKTEKFNIQEPDRIIDLMKTFSQDNRYTLYGLLENSLAKRKFYQLHYQIFFGLDPRDIVRIVEKNSFVRRHLKSIIKTNKALLDLASHMQSRDMTGKLLKRYFLISNKKYSHETVALMICKNFLNEVAINQYIRFDFSNAENSVLLNEVKKLTSQKPAEINLHDFLSAEHWHHEQNTGSGIAQKYYKKFLQALEIFMLYFESDHEFPYKKDIELIIHAELPKTRVVYA